MSTHAPTRLSLDDLLNHPDEKNFELVDGQLVELKMSMESSWIAGQFFLQLSLIVQQSDLGWVFPEGTGFECRSTGEVRIRKPDTSFILKSRLPDGPTKKGYGKSVPDLVVEVVSPNDLAYEVNEKVQEWLAEGVSLVAVVWPSTRTIVVHSSDADPHLFHESDQLQFPKMLPDFNVKVSQMFPPVV